MVLKFLEIHGFKSFADKTRITFNGGLTAVVGPNGSGKSNLSDALRWVMGEQSSKTLRGSNMEDVIFNGTKSRKQQGYAEVSLGIDNSDRVLSVDHDEVVITRRYNRSGDSEYRINGASVRLKDVHQLLMDTGLGKDGYAMVGQGRIAEIVQSKSDERRMIFEEAAGISKFRARKNEAQKKLNQAEENLVRLRDIVQELESRVGPLKTQSEKAKQFLVLAGERKELEISLWMGTLESANRQIKDEEDRILARKLEHTELEAQVASMEAQIATVYEQMQQALVSMDTLAREKQTLEETLVTCSAEIAVLQNEQQHSKEDQAQVAEQLAVLLQSSEEFLQTVQAHEADVKEMETTLSDTEVQKRELEEKLQQLLAQNGDSDDRHQALTAELNSYMIEKSNQELAYLQLQQQEVQECERFTQNKAQYGDQQALLEAAKADGREATDFLKTLAEKQQTLKNMLQGHQLKGARLQQQQDELLQKGHQLSLAIKEKEQRAAMLQDMENSMEGYVHSVKQVLKCGKQGSLSGILGTVSQLMTVPADYNVAIETALGGSLQHIIVEAEQHGKAAIRFLQSKNAGRATFLPLSAVKGKRLQNNRLEDQSGYVALACDLVTFDSKLKPVMEFLLGRIVIVEDLDAAVVIAKQNNYQFRIVTLDGQVVNAGGSMSGGSKNRSQGFFSRKTEILTLQKERLALQEKMKALEVDQADLQAIKAKEQAEVVGVESELQVVSEDRIRCESEQKRLALLVEQQNTLLTAMKEELDAFETRIADNRRGQQQAKEQAETAAVRLEACKEALVQMEGEQSAVETTLQRCNEQLTEFRLQQLEQQKDLENRKQRLREFQGRHENLHQQQQYLSEKQTTLSEKEVELQTVLAETEQRAATCRKRMEEIAAETTALQQKRTDCEGQTNRLRDQERDDSVRLERLSQEMTRFDEKRAGLQKQYDDVIRKLWDEYELTKAEAEEYRTVLTDTADANKQLASLKGQIRALGNVNVAAIEEYAEVSERYEFLSTQVADAEKARGQLLKMIAELTAQMSTLFLEQFHRINGHFQEIFVQLFGGGRATLSLTDPEEPLTCGIEIKVEPPGKIIKNLTSLSGGEQAFVAIAIYFAILQVRPSPFCVLDEIEAALDDVNVSKYATYLRRMTERTQFITITHRRGTMEEADTLYGVTMQQEGISKLLQLQVSEIEKQFGDQLN